MKKSRTKKNPRAGPITGGESRPDDKSGCSEEYGGSKYARSNSECSSRSKSSDRAMRAKARAAKKALAQKELSEDSSEEESNATKSKELTEEQTSSSEEDVNNKTELTAVSHKRKKPDSSPVLQPSDCTKRYRQICETSATSHVLEEPFESEDSDEHSDEEINDSLNRKERHDMTIRSIIQYCDDIQYLATQSEQGMPFIGTKDQKEVTSLLNRLRNEFIHAMYELGTLHVKNKILRQNNQFLKDESKEMKNKLSLLSEQVCDMSGRLKSLETHVMNNEHTKYVSKPGKIRSTGHVNTEVTCDKEGAAESVAGSSCDTNKEGAAAVVAGQSCDTEKATDEEFIVVQTSTPKNAAKTFTARQQSQPKTYASVTRRTRKHKGHEITVYPTKAGTITIDTIKVAVKQDDIPNGLEGIITKRDGGVILKTKTKDELDIVTKRINEALGLKIKRSETKNRIQITGIQRGQDIEQVLDKIYEDNPRITDALGTEWTSKLKLVTTIPCKNPRKQNIICETEEKVAKYLSELKRVFIDLTVHHIERYYDIPICFACSRFGHAARYCKNGVTCYKCGKDHDGKSCKHVGDLNCINCQTWKLTPRGHSARDRKCPVYRAKIEALRTKDT